MNGSRDIQNGWISSGQPSYVTKPADYENIWASGHITDASSFCK